MATHAAFYGEFDFLGAAQTANSNESNSFTPRIRQLYGTVDWDYWGLHLLAGQNWSLVTMNSKGITQRNEVPPPVIDAQYVPGFAWARQAQLRITKDFDDKQVWLAASLENPQTTFTGTSGSGLPAGVSVLDLVTGNSTINPAPAIAASLLGVQQRQHHLVQPHARRDPESRLGALHRRRPAAARGSLRHLPRLLRPDHRDRGQHPGPDAGRARIRRPGRRLGRGHHLQRHPQDPRPAGLGDERQGHRPLWRIPALGCDLEHRR